MESVWEAIPSGVAVGCLLAAVQAAAIEVAPSAEQVQQAVQRGRSAAEQRVPPDQLHTAFGSQEDLQPRGFVMTKIGSLVIMANHMALRALSPTEQDIVQILANEHLLVSLVIFGSRPNFAVDSYVVLEQNGRTIKPVNVRVDARAERSSVWPQQPAFRAKVVALFAYAELDPRAQSRLTVFPAGGGEVAFDLNFAEID